MSRQACALSTTNAHGLSLGDYWNRLGMNLWFETSARVCCRLPMLGALFATSLQLRRTRGVENTAQGFKPICMSRGRDAEMQANRDAGMQGRRNAGRRSREVQEGRDAGPQECWNAMAQEFRNAGMHRHWISEAQKLGKPISYVKTRLSHAAACSLPGEALLTLAIQCNSPGETLLSNEIACNLPGEPLFSTAIACNSPGEPLFSPAVACNLKNGPAMACNFSPIFPLFFTKN